MRKFFAKARSVLKSRRADGYVDTAVKMIIAVVVGAFSRSFRQQSAEGYDALQTDVHETR